MLLFLVSLIAGLLLMPLAIALTVAGGVLVAGALSGAGVPAALWLGFPLLSLAVLGRPLAVRLFSRRSGSQECQRSGAECSDQTATAVGRREGTGPSRRARAPRETLAVEGPGGCRLHVERAGEPGQPMLMLVPGLGQSTGVWDDVWPLVQEGCQIVTWDLPGLGRSAPCPDGDYSTAALAEGLRLVLESQADRIGPSGVVLVGQSLSAMLILEFCRLALDQGWGSDWLESRIAGLVLVDGTDSPPLTTMAHSWFWRRLRRPVIEPMLRTLIALAPLFNLLLRLCYHNGSFVVLTRAVAFSGGQPPELLDRLARILSHNPLQVTARIALQALDFDAAFLLPRIPVPVLLVHGAQDRVCTLATVERMARCLPRARLEVCDPARHVSCLEHPEWFRRLLAESVRAFRCSGVQVFRATRTGWF
jgi:pimeloyl-ACP methyl ester carboxylesterase